MLLTCFATAHKWAANILVKKRNNIYWNKMFRLLNREGFSDDVTRETIKRIKPNGIPSEGSDTAINTARIIKSELDENQRLLETERQKRELNRRGREERAHARKASNTPEADLSGRMANLDEFHKRVTEKNKKKAMLKRMTRCLTRKGYEKEVIQETIGRMNRQGIHADAADNKSTAKKLVKTVESEMHKIKKDRQKMELNKGETKTDVTVYHNASVHHNPTDPIRNSSNSSSEPKEKKKRKMRRMSKEKQKRKKRNRQKRRRVSKEKRKRKKRNRRRRKNNEALRGIWAGKK